MSDHHEAIISREVFEAANALIAQRGKEKGIIKGSEKYQSRYLLSGRIVCGECGDTFSAGYTLPRHINMPRGAVTPTLRTRAAVL